MRTGRVKPKLARVRIDTNNKPLARHWRVLVNDFDLSEYVCSLGFAVEANEVPIVTMCLRSTLELPDEFKASVNVIDASDVDVQAALSWQDVLETLDEIEEGRCKIGIGGKLVQ